MNNAEHALAIRAAGQLICPSCGRRAGATDAVATGPGHVLATFGSCCGQPDRVVLVDIGVGDDVSADPNNPPPPAPPTTEGEHRP